MISKVKGYWSGVILKYKSDIAYREWVSPYYVAALGGAITTRRAIAWWSKGGGRPEWHLLNLLRMSIFPDHGPC